MMTMSAVTGWIAAVPRGVGGGLPEDDEGVAAQHLAVEDAGAVEARRLDALDEPHELSHGSRAGHPEMNGHGRARWLRHHVTTCSRVMMTGAAPGARKFASSARVAAYSAVAAEARMACVSSNHVSARPS